MSKIKSFLLNLNATDLVVIGFYLILTAINCIFLHRIPNWFVLNIINLAVISFVFWIAYLDRTRKNKVIHLIHACYMVVLIMVTFKELYYIIQPLHGQDYDSLFIKIDRLIFGSDPTVFLFKYSNPVLTEILQWVYAAFYFLPIILGWAMWNKRKINGFFFLIFSMVYGFFLSYLGYIMLPAIGPRFTLHDFGTTDIELPGIWAAVWIRELLNKGEGINLLMANPAAVVQRDVFPSGHTQMTLITMYLSVKLKSRTKYFILPVGLLLIFSTVYLRYHYFIDLVGGFVFFVFTMLTGYLLYNWWMKKTGKEEFRYSNNGH